MPREPLGFVGRYAGQPSRNIEVKWVTIGCIAWTHPASGGAGQIRSRDCSVMSLPPERILSRPYPGPARVARQRRPGSLGSSGTPAPCYVDEWRLRLADGKAHSRGSSAGVIAGGRLSRSARAVSTTLEHCFASLGTRRYDRPHAQQELAAAIGVRPGQVLILGPETSKIIVVTAGTQRGLLVSLGRPIRNHPLLVAHPDLNLSVDDGCRGRVDSELDLTDVLGRPRILLVSLYHQEVFPLPRFPLAISDLAYSLRREFVGTATLVDMQLGNTVGEIVDRVDAASVDILGISVTFGQHDLLVSLLSELRGSTSAPLVIVGGSLAALNYESIARRFPGTLVCLTFGEQAIVDIARTWKSAQPDWAAVDNIAFASAQEGSDTNQHESVCVTRRSLVVRDAPAPELDLLPAILARGGVMQLEISRGCSFGCSFCPRDQKGRWAGGSLDVAASMLPLLSEIYSERPDITRRLYLIDEEFMGYRHDALHRARELATCLAQHSFRFESMTRADQVAKPGHSRRWHVERIEFWRQQADVALDRVLIGVESGVDSVLQRFNKKTTGQQNVSAIRTLTACGVPVRLTYITFDPLMSMEELVATYRFQGRRDLLLTPARRVRSADLFDVVRDEDQVGEWANGRPAYLEVPYMLVSLEVLLGSTYAHAAEVSGLIGPLNPLMGRYEARYVNADIGLLRTASQQWIDRNFALDYFLKSLMKLRSGSPRGAVAEVRECLKTSSYQLLGYMLFVATGDATLLPHDHALTRPFLNGLRNVWLTAGGAARQCDIETLMTEHFRILVDEFEARALGLYPGLSRSEREMLQQLTEEWTCREAWSEINAKRSPSVA